MWILLAMILIMPYERNPYLKISDSFLGIFPDFTTIKLLGILGLVWAVAQMMSGAARPRLLASRQARYFLLFLVTVTLAGLASGVVMRPLTRLLAVVMLLPVVVTFVHSESSLRKSLLFACASMILVFPYAMRQMFRFGGRLGVGLSEPNYLAIALLLLTPMAFVHARHARSALHRKLWTIGTGIMIVSIILTGSRGAFLGLLVVGFLGALKLTKNRFTSLAGAGVALLVLLVAVPNPLVDRLMASGLDSSVRDAGVEASNRERKEVLVGGLRMIGSNPLTGVGLGNFKPVMASYDDLQTDKIAHNTYLQLGAELGLPVLASFLLVVLMCFRSLKRSERMATRCGHREMRDFAVALQVGLLGYLVTATFLSAQFEKSLWLVLFLSICMERIIRVRYRATLDTPDTMPARATA